MYTTYFYDIDSKSCIIIDLKENVTVNQFCWGLLKAAQITKLSALRQGSLDRINHLIIIMMMMIMMIIVIIIMSALLGRLSM